MTLYSFSWAKVEEDEDDDSPLDCDDDELLDDESLDEESLDDDTDESDDGDDEDDEDDEVNDIAVEDEEELDEDDDEDCDDEDEAVGSSNSSVAAPQYATLAVALDVAPRIVLPILNKCLYGLLPNPPTNSSTNQSCVSVPFTPVISVGCTFQLPIELVSSIVYAR